MTTQRWDDEMLDNLANTVNGLSATVNGLSATVNELSKTVNGLSETVSELSESVEQTNHNLDILVGAVNALIERDNQRALEIQQLRQESEAYRRENDQRFNIVLEEIQFLIRQLGNNPNLDVD